LLRPLGEGAVTGVRFNLAFEGGDLHLELAHVLEQIGDATRRPRRQLLEQRRHLAAYLDGPLRQHVTEFSEQPPQAVDRRGALLMNP
jgi:hypothetical protein